MDDTRRRATVHDVAREAGVSLATVDRVLNGRPGVRAETAEKVAEAIRILDFRRDLSASMLARAREIRVLFLLPDGTNAFMLHLASVIERQRRGMKGERIAIATRRVKAFDSVSLAREISGLDPKTCDCAIVVATDDDRVRAAIEQANRRGIVVLTLVSDVERSARREFVGIDNVAAGRTAASLIGRFCPSGRIGIVAGSLGLVDHQQRLEGFTEVIREEFGHLEIVGPVEGFDNDARTEAAVAELLKQHGPIAALYNLGAGNAGLVAALDGTGRAGKVRVIAHELTDASRDALERGIIDVVLDQNPDGEVALALAVARSLVLGSDTGNLLPIEIRLFVRDNLPRGE